MSRIEPLTPQEIELLKGVDTPTVCNVIELFDVRPRETGYFDHRITCCFPKFPPMVGYATTATFRSHAPPRSVGVYSSLEDQVRGFADVPSPPIVVFQDLDSPPAAATFGEIMCSTYKAFGAAGLITSGAGRDLDQVETIGFPVFVGSVLCSHGNCHILDINLPVHVGGLTIRPGDLLHGDRNGITTIPHDIARAVARSCKEFIAAENEVLNYLKLPSPTVDGFTAARKRMLAHIDAIKKRCLPPRICG